MLKYVRGQEISNLWITSRSPGLSKGVPSSRLAATPIWTAVGDSLTIDYYACLMCCRVGCVATARQKKYPNSLHQRIRAGRKWKKIFMEYKNGVEKWKSFDIRVCSSSCVNCARLLLEFDVDANTIQHQLESSSREFEFGKLSLPTPALRLVGIPTIPINLPREWTVVSTHSVTPGESWLEIQYRGGRRSAVDISTASLRSCFCSDPSRGVSRDHPPRPVRRFTPRGNKRVTVVLYDSWLWEWDPFIYQTPTSRRVGLDLIIRNKSSWSCTMKYSSAIFTSGSRKLVKQPIKNTSKVSRWVNPVDYKQEYLILSCARRQYRMSVSVYSEGDGFSLFGCTRLRKYAINFGPYTTTITNTTRKALCSYATRSANTQEGEEREISPE